MKELDKAIEDIIQELGDHGFNPKEVKNLINAVRSKSPESLPADIDRWLDHIRDICAKEELIRMVAMGFSTIEYDGDEIMIALKVED